MRKIKNKKVVDLFKLLLKASTMRKNTVFFTFSGHVNSIGVRIYKGGWKKNSNPDIDETLYIKGTLSSNETFNDTVKFLKELINSKEKGEA